MEGHVAHLYMKVEHMERHVFHLYVKTADMAGHVAPLCLKRRRTWRDMSSPHLNLEAKDVAGHVLQLGEAEGAAATAAAAAAQPLKERMLQRFGERDSGGRVVLQHPRHQAQHEALGLALQAGGAAPAVLRQGAAVLAGVPGRR